MSRKSSNPGTSKPKAGFFRTFNPKLSKILTGLVLLAAVKLGILLFLSLDVFLPDIPPEMETGGHIFAASIVGVDKAHAQTEQTPQAAPAPAEAASAQDSGGKLPSLTDIQDLNKRKEELDRKEQALKQLEASLNTRMDELNQIEGQLKEAIKAAQETKDKQLKHLIDVYTNMKAKQAATVLETLDEDIAVKILAGMKGRQAGEILTNVSAKKAAALSEKLTKLQLPSNDLPAMP